MAVGVGEVVAAAGAVKAAAAATGAAGTVTTALVGAKWRAAAVLGPPAAGAPGLELTTGRWEVRRTRGRNE